MDSFYSEIKAEATDETIIERSKFICLIKKVETEEEAREVLSVIKKNHPFATHNCYAFILLSGAARFSDDGEPQGTAGQPMLEAIKNNGLSVAFVKRFFKRAETPVGQKPLRKAVHDFFRSEPFYRFVIISACVGVNFSNSQNPLPLPRFFNQSDDAIY